MAHQQQAPPMTSFPPLEAMTNKVKEKDKKKKKKRSSNIYMNSIRRHKTGDAEFLIVQSIKESLVIGDATPP